MTPRPVISAAGVALTATLLSGCVSPAFNHGAFRENASGAVGSALSESLTARLTIDALSAGKVTVAAANTIITENEDALGPIQSSFGNVDPPTRPDDSLRDAVVKALGDAEDAIAQARIAVRRGDDEGLREARASLEKASHALQQMKRQLG